MLFWELFANLRLLYYQLWQFWSTKASLIQQPQISLPRQNGQRAYFDHSCGKLEEITSQLNQQCWILVFILIICLVSTTTGYKVIKH